MQNEDYIKQVTKTKILEGVPEQVVLREAAEYLAGDFEKAQHLVTGVLKSLQMNE